MFLSAWWFYPSNRRVEEERKRFAVHEQHAYLFCLQRTEISSCHNWEGFNCRIIYVLMLHNWGVKLSWVLNVEVIIIHECVMYHCMGCFYYAYAVGPADCTECILQVSVWTEILCIMEITHLLTSARHTKQLKHCTDGVFWSDRLYHVQSPFHTVQCVAGKGQQF